MNPEEIKTILESSFPWWGYFFAFILAFFGSFLGTYTKRKAENLATKEDFDDLLLQVKKTTETTENIKANILKVSWVDQQRWQLKRELYLDLLAALYSEKEAIFKLSDEEKRTVPTDSEVLALREEFIKNNRSQSLAAIEQISKIRGVAGVLLTDESLKALDELAESWYESFERESTDFYSVRLAAADKAYSIVLKAATKDLGVKSAT